MSAGQARRYGIAMGLLLTAAVWVVLGYFAGPQIEARAFPILKALTIAGTMERDDRCICWSTQFQKARNGTPVVFDYRILHLGRNIPVAAYRANVVPRVYLSTYGFGQHPAGESWISRYCIDLPRDLPTTDPFTVEGDGVYDVWHRLWRIRQPLPSFEVLPKT